MKAFTFCMLENGKLPDGMKATLAYVLPSFAGKKVRMEIGEAKDRRSLSQNSFYWAAIVLHVRQARFDMGDPVSDDEVHEDLLEQFAPRKTCKRSDGSTYVRPKRSKEMNVKEMSDYVTSIIANMAQMGFPVLEVTYE